MLENLRLLYRYYGSYGGVFKTGYVWVAVFLATLVGLLSEFGPWYEIAHSTLPSLTGFSVAAFAIIFAVLNPGQVNVLISASGEEDKPPLMVVASSVCHAIAVQVMTIVYAGLARSMDFDAISARCCKLSSADDCLVLLGYFASIGHFVGYLLLFYSWLLVLAAALSVLRLMAIVSKN